MHRNAEDKMGGFIDLPSEKEKNIIEAEGNDKSVRLELTNSGDVSYLGPIFIGMPRSQGAMVVYDTGSDWLTVKSCITETHCHKGLD